MATEKSYFDILNAVNCNEHVEKKDCGNGVELSYLSWAWAWGIAKSKFPDSTYRVYENADGWNFFTDGKTCWVKTGVTINGIEHIEYLPVMDYRNRSILLKDVTSFDVNKAIQRSLTKAIARHGLGLYIYAGEDLPDAADDEARAEVNKKVADDYAPMSKEDYWKIVQAYAFGQKTKTGGDYKTTWMEKTHAKKEHIAQFEHDVEMVKLANGIQ